MLNNGQVSVTRYEHQPRAVIFPFQFGVEVWEKLSKLQRQNILRYFGIERTSSTPPPAAIDAVNTIHAEAQRGELERALLSSIKFTKRFPDVAELWSNRGAVLAKLELREEAIDCYVRSIELRREYQQAWINLAASLMKLDRMDEALCCINEAISQDPNNSDAWFNRGSALANLSEWRAAADAFDAAVKLNPQSTYTDRAKELAKYCHEMSSRVQAGDPRSATR
jgi:tetratricopeptide (TPR) repeat protein